MRGQGAEEEAGKARRRADQEEEKRARALEELEAIKGEHVSPPSTFLFRS